MRGRDGGRGRPGLRVGVDDLLRGRGGRQRGRLRHAGRLAGIVGLSTYLVDPGSLAAEASGANRGVPILMAHGLHDPVIRYEWAEASRAALERGGWKVEWHAYPMEHEASHAELRAVGDFLARVLAAPP